MNKLKQLRLELAKTLCTFSEFTTDKGSIYSENDWITTLTPVYVFGEDGSLLPAPSGEYATPETATTYKQKEVYTVVDGIVTDIQSINTMSETSEDVTVTVETEEAPSTEVTPETEIEQAEETPAEDTVTTEETPTEDVKPEDEFKKVYAMIETLVKEVETLTSTVESLSTTMDNAKLGTHKSIQIKDNSIKYDKNLHPIWSVK